MQVDIYINEQQIDTNSDTKIAETRQINDFFDIRDRQTSYTSSFKLPRTPKNVAILQGMGLVANTSLTPYRVHNVNIYREGIQTVFNGIAYFKATTDVFNLYVYNENVNLFDKIGDKSLADLNTQALRHDLNINTWLASFSNTDYVYAIADYGKLDGAIEINYQIPSLFVKYLWNKIFNENGYTYSYAGRGGREDFNPFITGEWNDLAITIDEGFPEAKESIDPEKKLEVNRNIIRNFTSQTLTNSGQEIVVNTVNGEITEYINLLTIFDPDYLNIVSGNQSRIQIKESGFYKIDLSGTFNNNGTENAAMYIEKDGVNLFTISDSFANLQSSFGFSEKVYLNESDELLIKIVTLPENNASAYAYDINLQLYLDNNVTTVNFSSYLSKIKQKDFIKDVMHHYGLMYRRKQLDYEFISFNELLDPLAKYKNYNAIEDNTVFEDWSHKFHKLIEQDSKVGRYARNNRFKYKYDNPEDTFADGNLKVDDQTISDETTLIQRPYKAPSGSATVIDGNILKECIFYTKEYNENGTLKSVKQKKTTPFFFKVKRSIETIEYRLAGSTGAPNPQKLEVPLMSFEDLGWNSIVSKNYNAFSSMINYGQKLKVELFLSVLDMNTLDFFKLKYIKQLGGLFYLSKSIQFTKTGITKVELIKIRSIEKLGEFSDDFSDDFNN